MLLVVVWQLFVVIFCFLLNKRDFFDGSGCLFSLLLFVRIV